MQTKTDREYRFGTFEERLAHLSDFLEIDPPEIVYEDGQPTLTKELTDWCYFHNVELTWLFSGDPSIALSQWSKRHSEEKIVAEYIEPMEPEVRSGFLAMLKAVTQQRLPMDEALATLDEVVKELRNNKSTADIRL